MFYRAGTDYFPGTRILTHVPNYSNNCKQYIANSFDRITCLLYVRLHFLVVT